jgi:hypothetical protein
MVIVCFTLPCAYVSAQVDTSTYPWYARVEYWLVPAGYNWLGTLCWLVNTLWPISYCLGMPTWVTHTLAPFALLYAWHECCQLAFVCVNWQERSAKMATGIEYMRMCSDKERKLLTDALASTSLQVRHRCGVGFCLAVPGACVAAVVLVAFWLRVSLLLNDMRSSAVELGY